MAAGRRAGSSFHDALGPRQNRVNWILRDCPACPAEGKRCRAERARDELHVRPAWTPLHLQPAEPQLQWRQAPTLADSDRQRLRSIIFYISLLSGVLVRSCNYM